MTNEMNAQKIIDALNALHALVGELDYNSGAIQNAAEELFEMLDARYIDYTFDHKGNVVLC